MSGAEPARRRVFGARQGIIGAALLLSLAFLGSRLLGAARAVVIADQFGASVELDAFWVAMRLPDIVFQLLAGATLASAFIPVYARVLGQRGEEAAWRLASIVLNWVMIGTIALAAVVFLAADWIVPLLAPGLGEESGVQAEIRAEAVFLTRVLLLSPILFAASGMATGMLHARRHFLLPGFAPMLYNLAIILAALFVPERFGVEALAIGVVAGSGLHLAVQLPALAAAGAKIRPRLSLGDPDAREVLKLMGPRMLGLAAAQINLTILTVFGSLVGDASISALNFAWLILMLPVGLLGVSLATAIFPTLAELAERGGAPAVRELTARALRFILFLGVPATLGVVLLRESIVATLLQRGAFDAAAAELVSGALLFYGIGLFAHTAIEILSRGFYALGDTRTPVTLAVMSMMLNLILAAALVDLMELRGLALALSIATISEAVILAALLHAKLGRGLFDGAALGSLAKTLIASAVMGQALFLGLFGLEELGIAATSWTALVAGVCGGAAAYALMAALLRHPELTAISQRALAARGR